MDTHLYRTGQPTSEAEHAPNHVAYRHVRHNVTRIVADCPAPEDLVVPACPEWTVSDLVAHLVGLSSLAIGRMTGAFPVPRSSSCGGLVTLLGEWDWIGPDAERLIAGRGGRRGSLIVMDSFTHELDLRYALGEAPPATHPAFARAFEVLLYGFSESVLAHNLPALIISVDGREWQAGIGEPVAALTANRYDLYRSLAGRRTHEQITRLDWSRDSHRWLPAFTWGPFSPPERPVEPLATEG